jgi:hypothetical protein
MELQSSGNQDISPEKKQQQDNNNNLLFSNKLICETI